MELAHTECQGSKTINIYYDPDPLDPRKEYPNPSTMVCWHPNNDLGDVQIEPQSIDDLIKEYAEKGDNILLIKPLYLLDHSGLTISTSEFSCKYDSGQVGWVFITQKSKDDFLTNPKILNRLEAEVMEILDNMLEGDVKVYDAYLCGRVFGYQILDNNKNVLESCWGYMDSMENCLTDARAIANSIEDPIIEEEVEMLSTRATYAGL